MQKITPFLWFDGNAEEAMNFYVSIFEDAKVGTVSRYGDSGPLPKGTLMTATFELFGQTFMVLNGGGSKNGRRQRAAVRMALGQVRSLLAGHPESAPEAPLRSRSEAGRARRPGDARDEEDRRERAGTSSRRQLASRVRPE